MSLLIANFDRPERHLIYGYPQAEYHKACSILMYTPGAELFDGVIHPDAGLYEKYFDIDKAADEHRNYISMLEKEGCSVHTVTNTLLSMPHDRLIALAEPSLTYDVSNLEISEQEAQGQSEGHRRIARKQLIRARHGSGSA